MTDDLDPQGVNGEALPPQDPETDPELEQVLSSVRVPDAEDPEGLRRRVLDAARRPAPARLEPPPRITHFFLPVAAVAGLAIAAALWLFFAILADPGETLVQSTDDKKETSSGDEPAAADEATLKARMQALIGKLNSDDASVRDNTELLLENYVRKHGAAAFVALEGDILPGLANELEARVRVQKVIERLTGPELAWSAATAPNGVQRSAPCVNEELNLVVVPSKAGLFVFDAGTGAVVWKKDGDQQQGTPVLTGEALYALNPQAGIAAYEPRTGKVLWTAAIDPAEPNLRRLDQTLAYDEKQGLILAATRTGAVVAFDREGKEVWRSEDLVAAAGTVSAATNPANVRAGLVAPAAAAALQKVFTGIQGKALVALNAADGKTVWRTEVEGISGDAPAVEAGRVIVHGSARGGNGMAFTGIKQEARVTAGQGQSFATSTVTIGVASKSFVSCFEAGSGQVVWSAQVDPASGGPVARPEQGVVVTQSGSALVAFDFEGGQRRWQVPLPRYGAGVCAEKDGVAYAGTDDGTLVALRVADGRMLWKRNFENDPAAAGAPRLTRQNGKQGIVQTLGRMGTPALLGHRLVCTTESGWTFALELPAFQSATQASRESSASANPTPAK